MLSTKDGRKIAEENYIYEDENVLLSFTDASNIPTEGKIIFALEAKQPNYSDYNEYAISAENICDGEDDDTEEEFFVPKTYLGRHSYCSITISLNLFSRSCSEDYCQLCTNDNKCFLCLYGYKLSINGDSLICPNENLQNQRQIQILQKLQKLLLLS